MVAINPHTTRATGTVLTAAIYNADHQNHITNAQNLNAALGTAQADILVLDTRVDSNDVILAVLTGKPTSQYFNTAGAATWTKPANCKRVIADGVGGGGGGGGVDGQGAGFAGAGSGGGAGIFGVTPVVDVSAIASGAIVIGAGGAASAAGNFNGGAGGDTTFTLGAQTFIWAGGVGGFGVTASNAAFSVSGGAGGGSTSALLQYGGGGQGGCGWAGAGIPVAMGGRGGDCPYGQGGTTTFVITSAASDGNAPSPVARGCGGGGAAVVALANNQAGAAGKPGALRVLEFY